MELDPTDISCIEQKEIGKDEWIRLSSKFSDLSYRQTWAYGEALARRRRAVSRHVAILHRGRLIGIADVRIKDIPFFQGGLAYISGGPLTIQDRGFMPERLTACLLALKEEYAHKRRMTLRIAPPLGPADRNDCIASCFEEAGFASATKAPIYRTYLLDIDREEAEIRKNLAQKWRNCLNAGEKNGFAIKIGVDMPMFEYFSGLLNELKLKKNFTVDLDSDFYATVQRCSDDQEKLTVAIVGNGDEIHAGGVFSMQGDTCVYLLGATAEPGLKTKASYFLHWQIIKLARSRGMKWYDLGGIDPEANPGVYAFKRGFGGQDLIAAGPYQVSGKGLAPVLVSTAESIYRKYRK
jgi:lipid II:glycine glycyltransferase (peptidoglycan interpeptide bridge formation enzyme)